MKLIYTQNQWILLEISIPVDKLFVLPEEYENLVQKCEKEIDRINREIYEIEEAEKLLELRIQLASPKQLQKLIGEVDSFGELSLFDMKLKQLSPEWNNIGLILLLILFNSLASWLASFFVSMK